jgi:hypothetical protein
MKGRDWFALGVRLFGVWLITTGAAYVATFVQIKLYPPHRSSRRQRRRLFDLRVIRFRAGRIVPPLDPSGRGLDLQRRKKKQP